MYYGLQFKQNVSDMPLRRQMVQLSRQLVASGLNRGTSGNLGARCGDGFLVTPSGLSPDEMTPDSLVHMEFSGKVTGAGNPSSEWRFHRDILAARPEVGAGDPYSFYVCDHLGLSAPGSSTIPLHDCCGRRR